MKGNKLVVFLLCIIIQIAVINAQEYNVTGYLKGELTGEPVIFAHCYSEDLMLHTTCNEEGYFHLKTSKQQLKLIFSHVGYMSDTLILKIYKDTCLHIPLREYSLNEVIVMSKETNFIDQSLNGKITISQSVINKTPSTLGEPDLIKTMSFLPGVSSGNKLFSNLYVRGGGRQNNLILIDDAPTYNSNHIFGLISVFNTDAVQQVDFYKSDFPAKYGGATSSIVDIYTRDGNFVSYSGKVKTSLLYSKLFAEGPIVKDKISFLFSGRCSYFDLLMIPFYSIYKTSGTISFPGYRFYDINSKLTYKISSGKKLNLVFFHGNDRFSLFDKNKYSDKPYNDELKNYFRNTTLSLQFKSDLFGSAYFRASAVYSKYKNIRNAVWETKQTENKQSREEYYLGSIENIRFKAQIDFKPGKNHLTKIGWTPATYFLQPGFTEINEVTPEGKTELIAGSQKLETAFENVLYIENDYNISDRFILNTGIRSTLFNHQISIIKLEPRISLRYKKNDNLSLKVGYSLTNQLLQCIANNTQQTGSEFWLLSDKTFPPEQSNLFNVGVSAYLPYNLEFTSDLYYKSGENAIYYNFVESDPEFLNNYHNLIFSNGKRQGYGLEIMFRKQSEKFQSLISYTLSRSFIQFEELNQNKKFPTQQDQLHDISFVFLWNINNINSLNLNFTYNSGAPITLPVAYINESIFYGGYYVYDEINNKRLPAFHRLDISWVRTKYTKKNRKREFYLNLYNAYAKQNAVYMFFADNKTYKTAVNLIIPSIGYVWYL